MIEPYSMENAASRSGVTLKEGAEIAVQIGEFLVKNARDLKLAFAGVISMPAEAEKAIEEILDELEKSLNAMDEASREFTSAASDPERLLDNEELLSDLSGRMLPNIVENGRGHCTRIYEIDGKFLNGWLNNVINNLRGKKEEDGLILARDSIFRLSNSDDDMFKVLVDVAKLMQKTAREAERHSILGNREKALSILTSSSEKVLRLRYKYNDLAQEMASIKTEFKRARLSSSQKATS